MNQLSERITYLRESYELVARMFAAGMSAVMISRKTGYSMRRLSLLWNDPTFQERLQQYQRIAEKHLEEAAIDYAEVKRHNALVAERLTKDKLEEAQETGELPSFRDLLAISGDWADRFGYSKRATQLNVNIDFASALDRAIERSGKTKVIEGRVTTSPQPPVPDLHERAGLTQSPLSQAQPARPSLANAAQDKFIRRF
jgi:hypothetical protein